MTTENNTTGRDWGRLLASILTSAASGIVWGLSVLGDAADVAADDEKDQEPLFDLGRGLGGDPSYDDDGYRW